MLQSHQVLTNTYAQSEKSIGAAVREKRGARGEYASAGTCDALARFIVSFTV